MNISNRFIIYFIISLISSVGVAQITVDNVLYELREDGTAKVTSTSKNYGNIKISIKRVIKNWRIWKK